MSTIYLAIAEWHYESSEPVKAFTSRDAADAFVAQCTEYHRTKEPFPDYGDDDVLDAWSERELVWSRAHPAYPQTSCDSFSVAEVELVDVQSAATEQTNR